MGGKTTLSEQFQNAIKIVEIGKIDTLTLKYMTAHFPGLIPALQ